MRSPTPVWSQKLPEEIGSNQNLKNEMGEGAWPIRGTQRNRVELLVREMRPRGYKGGRPLGLALEATQRVALHSAGTGQHLSVSPRTGTDLHFGKLFGQQCERTDCM